MIYFIANKHYIPCILFLSLKILYRSFMMQSNFDILIISARFRQSQNLAYLAMICSLAKLQIRFEYHMFLKISKDLINSRNMQFSTGCWN
jgi:hypothetical protein